MLSFPRRSKFKKQQKGKSFNRINSSSLDLYALKSGSLGIKALSCGRLTSKQIESVRQCISKIIKKQGRVKTNVFPDTPISKKPIEVRMGKGKGAPDHWICRVQAGHILFEMDGISPSLALQGYELANAKCPFNLSLISL